MLILIFLLGASLVSAKCPLTSVESPDHTSCYLVSSVQTNWKTSENICLLLGGHLASVHNNEQNDAIVKAIEANPSILDGSEVWLGGNHANGSWQNVDGTPFDYFNFGTDQHHSLSANSAIFIQTNEQNKNTTKGYWSVQNGKTEYFSLVCELPPCGADGSAPASLLNPNANIPGFMYSNLTNAWYFNSKEGGFGNSSEEFCSAMGAHLPSVHNAFENTELMSIGKAFRQPEIGLGYVSDSNGVLSWTDGSRVTSYANWNKRPPGTSWLFPLFESKSGLWFPNQDLGMMAVCEFRDANRASYC